MLLDDILEITLYRIHMSNQNIQRSKYTLLSIEESAYLKALLTLTH